MWKFVLRGGDELLCGNQKQSVNAKMMEKVDRTKDHKFESLIKERDHYQKEYADVLDKLMSITLRNHNNSRESPLNNLSYLIVERDEYYRQTELLEQKTKQLERKLNDQTQRIVELKHKHQLLEDKHTKAVFTAHLGQVPYPSQDNERKDLSGGTGVDLETYLTLQDERDKLYVVNCKLQEEKGELLSRTKKVQIDALHEDRIRALEVERTSLVSRHVEMNARLGELEEENRDLKQKLYSCEHELCEERNSRHSARRIQEQQDQSLLSFRRSQESLETQISELKLGNTRLDNLRQELECKLHSVQDENIRLKSCLHSLDTKNDTILRTLDSKKDLLDRLERDMTSKDAKIEQLEDRIAKLKSTLESTIAKYTQEYKRNFLEQQEHTIGKLEISKYEQYKLMDPINSNVSYQDKIMDQIQANIFYQEEVVDRIEGNISNQSLIAEQLEAAVVDRDKIRACLEKSKAELDTVIAQVKTNIFYEGDIIRLIKNSKLKQLRLVRQIETSVFRHDQIIRDMIDIVEKIEWNVFTTDDGSGENTNELVEKDTDEISPCNSHVGNVTKWNVFTTDDGSGENTNERVEEVTDEMSPCNSHVGNVGKFTSNVFTPGDDSGENINERVEKDTHEMFSLCHSPPTKDEPYALCGFWLTPNPIMLPPPPVTWK